MYCPGEEAKFKAVDQVENCLNFLVCADLVLSVDGGKYQYKFYQFNKEETENLNMHFED